MQDGRIVLKKYTLVRATILWIFCKVDERRVYRFVCSKGVKPTRERLKRRSKAYISKYCGARECDATYVSCDVHHLASEVGSRSPWWMVIGFQF